MFDGARNTFTVLQAVAATGYVAIYAIPIGFAMGLLGRLVVRSWRARQLIERTTEDTGGAPLLAAAVVYGMFALWLFAGVSLNSMRLLIYRSPAKPVVMLGTTIAVALCAGALLVLSKPCVAIGGRLLRRVDAWTHRKWQRSFMAPSHVLIGSAVVFAGLAAGAWFVSFEPRLVDIDLALYRYLAGFVVLVFAVQALWLLAPPLRQARLWVSAAVAGALLATSLGSIGTGYYVRHKRPYAMLEVWGNTVLAGIAVDRLFNIQLLRRDLRLPGLAPKEKPKAGHTNVVLITIDNARADRTGFYSGAAKMPTMQRLRREGIIFDWAFAAGTVTRRSLPPIVLGVSPNRVRGRVTGQALRLDPRHVLLAERFRAAGYETAGFLSPGMLFSPSHNLGLVRGLDHLVVPESAEQHNGDWLVRQARAYLRERRKQKPKQKLFLWVHFSDLSHWEHKYSPAEFGRKKRPRYDMACEDVDKYLGFLLVDVWNTQTKHNTILAIVGDHGVALDEDKQTWSTGPLGTGRLRVPLFIGGVGRKGRRIQLPVATVDLGPTLLDLAGYVPPGMPYMDGKSFSWMLTSTKRLRMQDGEAYSVAVKDGSVPLSRRALMRGHYKLIEHESNRPDELYNFRGDPREQRNLVLKKPKIYQQLKKRMRQRVETDRVRPF